MTVPPGCRSPRGQNYFADAIDYRFGRVEESAVFGYAAQTDPRSGDTEREIVNKTERGS